MMEVHSNVSDAISRVNEGISNSSSHFMEANTLEVTQDDLQNGCIIPVFAKDNESTISHVEFINTVGQEVSRYFHDEDVLSASIRCSHPIKGRIPEAMGKPAKFLTEDEKTLYYERMAFVIEIPSIRRTVAGNELALTIGGVRAYNHDNLYAKKGAERFKLFIGFQNKVCTNLCISTDGFVSELKVQSVEEIARAAIMLFSEFDAEGYLNYLSGLSEKSLSESQFAQILGKARLYNFLPPQLKKELPEFPLVDNQVNAIAKGFYHDHNFLSDKNSKIDLWRVYNLLTGANKSSYIDRFLDRGVGCNAFMKSLNSALEEGQNHWFLQ